MISVINRYYEHVRYVSNRHRLWSQAQALTVTLFSFSEGCLALHLILLYTSWKRIWYNSELCC